MTNYIDKAIAMRRLVDLPAELDAVAVQRCIEAIHGVSAADVVEVVYCKDCQHCMAFKDKSDGFYGHCRIWLTRVISNYAALVDADGYCSYGKRKEG